jgi:hypothetical protein
MSEIPPPYNQVSNAIWALSVFAATSAGVSKMPAPMTIPTMIAMASAKEIALLGVALSEIADV